jgi:hypothetical protein
VRSFLAGALDVDGAGVEGVAALADDVSPDVAGLPASEPDFLA